MLSQPDGSSNAPHGYPPPVAPVPGADEAAPATDLQQQVSRLNRILKQAGIEGSESDVVCAFVEALAVWHDAESWGYSQNFDGEMLRSVSLPGSPFGAAPPLIGADRVPLEPGLTSIGPSLGRELGFVSEQALVFLTVRPRIAAPWVIAVAWPDGPDEAVLAEYGQSLAAALDELAAVESSRATWAMLQHLLPEAAPADAADRAIRELSSVMRCPVGLAVHTRDGRLLLASGDNTETLGRTTSACSRDLIAMTVGSARPRRAVLGARGSAGRPLGPRDERLLAAAAIPLAAWLRAVGGRLAPVHERRSRWRSFEEVVAQHEADAAALHHDLSMIVLEVSDAARAVDDPDTWVGDIRRQLRPSDLTGQLSGGDIGILLPQTSGEGASVVAARLRRLIDLEKRLAPLARAAISIATSSDGHRVTLLLAAASVQTAHASDSQ